MASTKEDKTQDGEIKNACSASIPVVDEDRKRRRFCALMGICALDSARNAEEPNGWTRAYDNMGGNSLVLLFKKVLTVSDVNSQQHRLLVNNKETLRVLFPAMEDWEQEQVKEETGVEATAIDESGYNYTLKFKYWRSSKQFVFTEGWSDLVAANKLRKDDRVSVWFLRHGEDGELGFLVIKE